MADEIDLLIAELERLIKEKNEHKQQSRSLFPADKTLEELFAEIEKDQKEFLSKLRPRSNRRLERFDETIKDFKDKLSKPSGKLN